MRPRTATVLVLLAVAALAAAWFVALRPAGPAPAAAGLAFPGLAARLPQATQIQVVHQDQHLTLARQGDGWAVQDRDSYPAQPGRAQALLIGLSELRLLEPRTADPANYARLGVDDPAGAQATGSLVRVLDAQGQAIAALILGHSRMRTQGDLPEAVYVRRPDEATSWLAEGRADASADPQQWLDRDIVDLGHADLASVAVDRAGQTLRMAADHGKLALAGSPAGIRLDDYKLDDVAHALEALTLTDVVPAGRQPGQLDGTAVFATTDGLTVTVTVTKVVAPAAAPGSTPAQPDVWVHLAASGTGAAKPRADAIAARTGAWAYKVQSWKEQALVPTLDDLKVADKPPVRPSPPPTQ